MPSWAGEAASALEGYCEGLSLTRVQAMKLNDRSPPCRKCTAHRTESRRVLTSLHHTAGSLHRLHGCGSVRAGHSPMMAAPQ